MTNPDISIIVPHLRKSMNDAGLQLNIARLLENTHYSFELVVSTEICDPYKIWNEASKVARSKILIFSNTDVIMAKGWDIPFVDNIQDNAILTGYLVEPGNIGVASENIHRDFGKTPYTFRPQEFEDFAAEHAKNVTEVKTERGWYMPCAVYRDWFNWTGGFDTTLGFPNPNDILFWNKVTSNFGTKLLRVRSYAYHFQALSTR